MPLVAVQPAAKPAALSATFSSALAPAVPTPGTTSITPAQPTSQPAAQVIRVFCMQCYALDGPCPTASYLQLWCKDRPPVQLHLALATFRL